MLKVQAWRWGLVFPDLYFAVKQGGRRPIGETVVDFWNDE